MKIQTMERGPIHRSTQPARRPQQHTPQHRDSRTVESQQPNQLRTALTPLIFDVAIPLGSYYLLKDGFGVGLVMSLALSSVVPAARSVIEFVRARKIEGLAILMVAVNAAGIIISFTTGNARAMVAKDSVLSSVIAVGILISVWRGQPLMTAGLKPFITKGNAAKVVAWDRLRASSTRFRTLERRYSFVWGVALLGDSVARVVGAYTLSVSTMVWGSTAMVIAAIGIAAVVSGGIAADPLEKLVAAETNPQSA